MNDTDEGLKPPEPLTVYQLTAMIKAELETGFSRLFVEGEISNFRVYPSGHAYFTLKDERAQIKGVMWKGHRAYLKFEPSDGDQVVVRGRISVYEKRGEYQVVAESMEPLGLGALQAAYEKLKKKLAAEGLFDEERKRELPYIPWTVGIVTSPKGAAIRDMIRTINRRFPGIHIILRPAQVQGEGAGTQVAQAIEDLNAHGKVEVIIAGRGGGSIEDLWAFNEEVVARAIAKSKVPVISAVGHETDFTIADFVADKRASTPTAAAEIIAPEKDGVYELLNDYQRRLEYALRDWVERGARRTDELTERLQRSVDNLVKLLVQRVSGSARHLGALSPQRQLEARGNRLAEARRAILFASRVIIDTSKARVKELSMRMHPIKPTAQIEYGREKTVVSMVRLIRAQEACLLESKNRLENLFGKLKAFDPQKTLERGYSIVTSPDGRKVYKSVEDLGPGEDVKIKVRDGEREARIKGGKQGSQSSLF